MTQQKNTSDGMVTFLVQLQASELTVLLKKDSCQICEHYKTIFLLSQKTAWQLLHSTSNILNLLFTLLAINQFNHS